MNALVTGVGRRIGIGYAIARRLGAAGASLMLQSWAPHDAGQAWGADPAGAEGVTGALRAELPGVRIEHEEADFLDPGAPERLVDAAVEAGHIRKLTGSGAVHGPRLHRMGSN